LLTRAIAIGRASYQWDAQFAAEMGLMLHSHIAGAPSNCEVGWIASWRQQKAGGCLMNFGPDPYAPNTSANLVDAWVSVLFVDEQHRGKGIGDRLLTECISSASNMTIDRLGARVSDRQQPLIKLLKKHGFKAGQRSREDRRYGPLEVWRDYTMRPK
jgi:GNAT superfamily N-acetyltransferase